jgi:hypothetical protein
VHPAYELEYVRFALPADQIVTDPLPKFVVVPSASELPPEIPAPFNGTCSVFAFVSSVHPIVSDAAALPAVAQAKVASM